MHLDAVGYMTNSTRHASTRCDVVTCEPPGCGRWCGTGGGVVRMDEQYGRNRIGSNDVKRGVRCLLLCVTLSACATQPAMTAQLAPHVAELVACADSGRALKECKSVPSALIRVDKAGRVQLDVSYQCNGTPPLADLNRMGFKVSAHVHAPPLCAVEGWMIPNRIRMLQRVPNATAISLPAYGRDAAVMH